MSHGKQKFDCPECEIILNTADAVESHYNRKHKMKPLLSREMCYHWKNGAFEDELVMVAVLVKNIPEEGSGRSKDGTVCNRRLFIFQDQGNISKDRYLTPKVAAKPNV